MIVPVAISPERALLFEQSWVRLMERLGLPLAESFATYDALIAAYSAPARHYHNLQHLSEVFRVSGRLAEGVREPLLLQLAIWFHDSVYAPPAADSEERSAAFAGEALGRLGLAPEKIAAVRGLILATATHTCETADLDTRVLLESDLAILGAEAKRYDAYAAAIRKEYGMVGDEAYRQGRLQFLDGMLARPAIFTLERMVAMGEQAARENMSREWQQLLG